MSVSIRKDTMYMKVTTAAIVTQCCWFYFVCLPINHGHLEQNIGNVIETRHLVTCVKGDTRTYKEQDRKDKDPNFSRLLR